MELNLDKATEEMFGGQSSLKAQAKLWKREELEKMLTQVSDHYGVPRDIMAAMIDVESGWKPWAKSPKSSATGIAQFIDGTAKGYFKNITGDENDDRWHPGKSMDAMARHLVDLKNQHGDWRNAVGYYYGGDPKVSPEARAAQRSNYTAQVYKRMSAPPPREAEGFLGQAKAGAHTAAGYSLGKAAEHAAFQKYAHTPISEMETEAPGFHAVKPGSIIEQLTPEYEAPRNLTESLGAGLGGFLGMVPELALETMMSYGIAPVTGARLATMLSPALAFGSMSLGGPEASGTDLLTSLGAGGILGAIHPLGRLAKIPIGAVLGYGQAQLAHPEAPTHEKIAQALLMSGLVGMHGKGGYPSPETLTHPLGKLPPAPPGPGPGREMRTYPQGRGLLTPEELLNRGVRQHGEGMGAVGPEAMAAPRLRYGAGYGVVEPPTPAPNVPEAVRMMRRYQQGMGTVGPEAYPLHPRYGPGFGMLEPEEPGVSAATRPMRTYPRGMGQIRPEDIRPADKWKAMGLGRRRLLEERVPGVEPVTQAAPPVNTDAQIASKVEELRHVYTKGGTKIPPPERMAEFEKMLLDQAKKSLGMEAQGTTSVVSKAQELPMAAKINDITYGTFLDKVRGRKWKQVKHELETTRPNFTDADHDHFFNPTHVLSRLYDAGMDVKEAQKIANSYTKVAWEPYKKGKAPVPASQEVAPAGEPLYAVQQPGAYGGRGGMSVITGLTKEEAEVNAANTGGRVVSHEELNRINKTNKRGVEELPTHKQAEEPAAQPAAAAAGVPPVEEKPKVSRVIVHEPREKAPPPEHHAIVTQAIEGMMPTDKPDAVLVTLLEDVHGIPYEQAEGMVSRAIRDGAIKFEKTAECGPGQFLAVPAGERAPRIVAGAEQGSVVGTFETGPIKKEWKLRQNPETGAWEFTETNFKSGRWVSGGTVKSGTLEEVRGFMNTYDSPRWQKAEKPGELPPEAQAGPDKPKTFGGTVLATGINVEQVKQSFKTLYDFGRETADRFRGIDYDKELGLAADSKRAWDYVARLPFWLAKSREEVRNHLETTYNRIHNFQDHWVRWRQQAMPFFQHLPIEKLKPLEALFIEGDKIGDLWGKIPKEEFDAKIQAHRARVEAAGLTPEYMAVRGALDQVWTDWENALARRGIPRGEIAKMRQQMGYKPEYFPRTWEDGKYYIVARRGEEAIRHTARSKRQAVDIKRNLLKEGYAAEDIRIGLNENLPENIFTDQFGLRPEHIAQVAKDAMRRAGIDHAEIEQHVADALKSRGAMSHFIARKNVGGYRTTGLQEVLENYFLGASGFISKMDASGEYIANLGKVDPKATPSRYNYLTNMVKNDLENMSRFDKQLSTVRGLMFHKFLGMVVKSAVVNSTQNVAAFAPWMRQYTKNPTWKVSTAMKDILSDWGNFRRLMKGEEVIFKNLPGDESAALNQLFRMGVMADWQTSELTGRFAGKGQGILDRAMDASRFMFGTVEQLNRVSAALAAWRVFRGEMKMEPQDALIQTRDAVLSSHYLMGKYNLPEVARGSTGGKMWRSSGYQFKQFSHNYLEMMAHLWKEDKMAFSAAVRNLSLLAGPLALPIVNEAYAAYKWLTGTDPIAEMPDKENNPLYIATKHGLPGFMGTDLAGSLTVEVIRPDFENPKEMTVNALLGPFGQFALTEVPNAFDYYKRGENWRAAESIAPSAIKNVLKGVREIEGMTTKTGRELYTPTGEKIQLTGGEAAMRALGFQPTSASMRWHEQENLQRRMEHRSETQDMYATRLIHAMRKGDDAEMERIIDKVVEYNMAAAAKGEPAINLSEVVKDRMKPKLPPKQWHGYALQTHTSE